MKDLGRKIDRLLAESHPKSELALSFVLVRWENGQQIRLTRSLEQIELYEKEFLIDALTESIRELEQTLETGKPSDSREVSRGSDEKVYLDYRDVLVTSKRLLLRSTNTTYLISEVRRPRIETSTKNMRQFSLWDTLFGPGITRSGETMHTDKLIVSVSGADVVVDEHTYFNFSHAGALYDRRAEFDAQGLSDDQRRRKVEEQHEEDTAGSQGSKNWAARQRYLKRVAEAIGAAIAGA